MTMSGQTIVILRVFHGLQTRAKSQIYQLPRRLVKLDRCRRW